MLYIESILNGSKVSNVSNNFCENKFLKDRGNNVPSSFSVTDIIMYISIIIIMSVVVKPVGCTAKLSETPLETAYGREMNIQFTGNSSGGHSCSQHANCTLPQN